MKKCPYCAEEVQDNAIKCKHCKVNLPLINNVTPKLDDSSGSVVGTGSKLTTASKNKIIFKIIGWVLLVLLSIGFWYLTIPSVVLWFIWKRTKLHTRTKIIITVAPVVILIAIIGIQLLLAPKIYVSEPLNNTTVQEETVMVKGRVEPSDAVAMVNKAPAIMQKDGTFTYSLTLSQAGRNEVSVYAKRGSHTSWPISLVVQHVLTPEEQAKRQKALEEQQAKAKIEADAKDAKANKEWAETSLSLVNSFDEKLYRADLDHLLLEPAFFATFSDATKKAQQSTDPSTKQAGDVLAKALQKLQISQFPRIRKAYVDFIGQKLWVNDVKVTVSGSFNENITFTAGVFAANKNISAFHDEIEATLTSLRFDRVNYKWIPSASEWTYFDLKAQKDGDL